MDENANQDVDLENNDLTEVADSDVSVEDQLNDLRAKNADLLKKLAITLRHSPKEGVKETKEEATDYGLLAYLKTSIGLEHPEDIALFNKVRSETGKKPEEIVASKYFLADLKEQRDTRESREAQPSRNNRSSSTAIDEASNWANKIESKRATIEDVPPDMRYEVIQKRIAREQSGNVGASFLAKIAAKQARKG